MFGVDPLDRSATEALSAWRTQCSAGVSLIKSLRTAASMCRRTAVRAAFESAAQEAERGADFETILEKLIPVLVHAERAVLAAGWNSGKFDQTLLDVVKRRHLLWHTRRLVRGQMIKPIFIFIAACGIVPLPRFLLTGDWRRYLMEATAPLAAAVLIGWTIAVFRRLQARRWSRHAPDVPPPPTWLDRCWANWPATEMVTRWRNLSEFGLLASTLLRAGRTTRDALKLCACVLPNGVYRMAVAELARRVDRGTPVAQAMQEARRWPVEWIGGVEVGEAAGELDRVLDRLGQQAGERYTDAVRAFGRWFPRLAYVGVAGFIVYQILQMWSAVLPLMHGF